MMIREASSLILLAMKRKPFTSFYNYKMLMLKRSQKSSFMPSTTVFPGGALDPADSDPNWLELFKCYGYPEQKLINEETLPPVLKSQCGAMNKDLALRIAAIRETFEETGILLCKSVQEDCSEIVWSDFNKLDVSSWRSKVQTQAAAFLELCKTVKCVPDVWSLKLWSNWLTPPNFQKRFDTVFYTACLKEEPTGTVDSTENSEMSWYSPERLKSLNEQKQILLPPPQFYELSRLMTFCMLEDIAEFAHWREQFGCDRYANERKIPTTAGFIFPMPGDDLMDADDEIQFSDFEEARKASKSIHRLEISKDGSCKVIVENVSPSKNHILPPSTKEMKQCCKM